MLVVGPQHGGDLDRAIELWGGSRGDWIDCSASIAPRPYLLPPVPEKIWRELPHDDARLLAAARRYYGCKHLIATPGSQAAIQILPVLREPSRVAVVSPTYAEHTWRWQQAGHSVSEIHPDEVARRLDEFDVLIVVNPNNPTGRIWPRSTLRQWHDELARRGGWLIVDEAFADAAPAESLIEEAGCSGLIILRSLGKFFGLAGLRLGFMAAELSLLYRMSSLLGPWSISAPAQWAGTLALTDHEWQTKQAALLVENAHWLAQTLAHFGLPAASSLPLLCWCPTPRAAEWQARLAEQHIWCRRFADGLRFGPVGAVNEFMRRIEIAAGRINSAQTEPLENPS